MASDYGEPFLMVLVFIIGIGIIHAALTGTQGAWFAELFTTNTRTSGASIGYQVAASIAGFAPFLAVMLAERSAGWVPRCSTCSSGWSVSPGCSPRQRRGERSSAPRSTP
jgi:hypothetical protein